MQKFSVGVAGRDSLRRNWEWYNQFRIVVAFNWLQYSLEEPLRQSVRRGLQKSVDYMCSPPHVIGRLRAFLWLLVVASACRSLVAASVFGGGRCPWCSGLDWSIIIIWKQFPINHFCFWAPSVLYSLYAPIMRLRLDFKQTATDKHRWGVLWCKRKTSSTIRSKQQCRCKIIMKKKASKLKGWEIKWQIIFRLTRMNYEHLKYPAVVLVTVVVV